jgi:hypothetical protein
MEICSLLIPFVILELIGYAILWPLIQKKPKLRIPRQFSIADFAALLCYVQLVMALTYYYRRLFEGSLGLGVAMSIMGAATVALWGAAVSTLNQLELHNVLRRSLFLLVLLPGVIGVMAGAPLVLVLPSLFDFRESNAVLGWILGGSVGVVLLGIGLRFLAAWLVKDAKVR